MSIGLNLAVRDTLHDRWGRNVGRNMLLLIAAGGLLSYALNAGAGRIALASAVAFAASEGLDALAYHAARERPYLLRSNLSNLVGAAADSILFPVLAFGGFPAAIIAAQFAAKVLGGALWALGLSRFRRSEAAGPVTF